MMWHFRIFGLVVLCCRLRLPMRLPIRVRVVSSQHTPAILDRYGRRIVLGIEDAVTEFVEEATLKWFCEIISNHLRGGAVLDLDFPTLCTVSDKVISYINVSSPLAAGYPTIMF